jgi:hypothetical protein
MKTAPCRLLEGGVLHAAPAVYSARMPEAAALNAALQRRFAALRDDSGTRRNHYFLGRFENLYVERACIPEVEPVLDAATGCRW